MFADVRTGIPGPKSLEFLEISRQFEPRCMSEQVPVVWDHAKGAIVTDVDGNTFIDFTSGVLVTNIGPRQGTEVVIRRPVTLSVSHQ